MLPAENEGSSSRGSVGFVVPRIGAMMDSERPYSFLVWPLQRKALAVMRQASGTEDGCSSGVVEFEGRFSELRSVLIQLS